MVRISVPTLTTLDVFKLAELLPQNVYVQQVTVKAERVWEEDRPHIFNPRRWVGNGRVRPPFKLYRTKENYYGGGTMTFAIPTQVWNNTYGTFLTWEDLVEFLQDQDREVTALGDRPLSERLYIKDLILTEIPADVWHPRPYSPTGIRNGYVCDLSSPECIGDPLYHNQGFYVAGFAGNYKLLGVGRETLEGKNMKPMNMAETDYCRTRHTRSNHRRVVKAYEVVRSFDSNQTQGWDEATLRENFPSLWASGLLGIRVCEGRPEHDMKFRSDYCRLIRDEAFA